MPLFLYRCLTRDRSLDIENRSMDIIGINGQRLPAEEVDEILRQRRAKWIPRPNRYSSGVLNLYAKHAVSPMKGAYML